MEPTRKQRFYAANWPGRIWLSAGVLVGMVGLAVLYGPAAGPLSQPSNVAWLLYYLALAGLLGLFTAGFFGIFVLGPLYYGQSIENGAPYQPGDHVRILTGPHRDQVVEVYEVWEERGQIRVRLGDREARDCTDVFGLVEVCREVSS